MGQGYIGQALGIADMLAVPFFRAPAYCLHEPKWVRRHRFLLPIGCYAIALCAALIKAGEVISVVRLDLLQRRG